MSTIDPDILSFVPDAPEPSKPDREVLSFADEGEKFLRKELESTRKKVFAKQEEREREREEMLSFARKRLGESWTPNLKATAVGLGTDVLAPLVRTVGGFETADKINRLASAYQQAAAEMDEGGVVPPIIKRGLRGVGRTLPVMVAASPAGPFGPIAVAATQEADKAITEGQDAGLEGGKLAGYAIGQGVIEGSVASVFQKVGLGGAEKILGGKQAATAGIRAGLKSLGRSTLEELPEEIITEIGHNVATAVSGVDPKATSLGSLMQTAADTTVQTLMTMGVVGGPGVAKSASLGRQLKVRNEIIKAAESGKAPSRAQWKKWGLDPEKGQSIKDRRAVVKELAGTFTSASKAAAPAAVETQIATAAYERPEAQEATAEAQETQVAQPEVSTPVAEQAAPAVSQEIQAAQPEAMTMETQQTAIEPQGDDTQEAGGWIGPVEHDMEVEAVGTGEVFGGREVVREIQSIWNAPVRIGRTGRKKTVRGLYKLRPEVVRLAKGEEASPAVAAHEIAHHLDNTSDILKKAPKDARQEVGVLDYDQSQKRDFEGFAEFVNAYITGSAAVKKRIDLKAEVPKFLAHFESWLGAHPETKAKIEATRDAVTRWRKAGAVGRVKGQISKTGLDVPDTRPIVDRVNEWKEFLYARFKEEGRPIQRFTKEAIARGYDPKGDATPFEHYNALRQIGPHFATTAIEQGVFRLSDMQKIGPSLREAMAEIGDQKDYENFCAWAYARHAIESWQHGRNPGITLDDANSAYSLLYDPRYERAADKVTAFNNALIAVLADTGAIDGDTAKRMIEKYEHYIPLERAKEGKGLGGGGRRMVDLSAAVKQRRGSGLQIIDPMESTLSRAIRLYERAAQQVVTNKLVEVATKTKGMGEWVEEVPTKVIATKFSLTEVMGQLESAGIPKEAVELLMEVVDPTTLLTVWRPDLMKVHDQPIVRVTINGQPRFFQVHPELAQALGGLDTLQNLDLATRTARALTGMLKLGATRLNPDFILSNVARDFQTFLMQGEKGLKGAFDPAKYAAAYVVSELRHAAGEKGDGVVELFRKMGGELSTYAGLDRNRLRKGVRRTLAGRPSRLATALNIAGTSEIAPRIAEFSAILKKEGWLERVEAGQTPPMSVLIRAINAAHDVTVDFRRMGKWGRYLNYYIPFFNARLEGLDKVIRTFKDKPTRTALRVAMSIVPVAIVYWLSRHDDDDYKERPEWLDNFFVLKDSEGNPAFRIPKSQEWGVLESGIERMLDAMYDKDPDAMKRWASQVVMSMNPGSLPGGVTPLFETMFNWDSFRDRPIISQSLQKLQAQDQFYEYTSKFAKEVARTLHDASGGKVSLSPANIDHLANGLSGGLYSKINAPIDKLIDRSEWGMADVPGLKGLSLKKDYAKSVDDFYAHKETIDKAHESGGLRGEEAGDLNEWRKLQYVSALMTDIRKAARSLSKDDKTQTDLALIGLARAALGRDPLARYPNPLADPSVVPGEAQSAVRKHIAQKAVAASNSSPKSYKEAAAAASYLRAMGVNSEVARNLAYSRMRSHGVKPETAQARAGRTKRSLP